MKSSLFLAIIWTISFIVNIIAYAVGAEPTWFSYFCMAGVLVLSCWERYVDDIDNE